MDVAMRLVAASITVVTSRPSFVPQSFDGGIEPWGFSTGVIAPSPSSVYTSPVSSLISCTASPHEKSRGDSKHRHGEELELGLRDAARLVGVRPLEHLAS